MDLKKESKVRRILTHNPDGVTRRQISQGTGVGGEELETLLRILAKKEGTGENAKYTLAPKTSSQSKQVST